MISGNSVKQSSYISTKKTIVSVGSRRALADLSNSEKPSTCLASKNLSRKLSLVDGEHNACKPTSPSGANTSVLVEFSNSGKPSTLLASTKNHSSKWSTENGEIKVPKPVSSVPGGINVPKPTSSQAPEKHQFNGRGKVNGWKGLNKHFEYRKLVSASRFKDKSYPEACLCFRWTIPTQS